MSSVKTLFALLPLAALATLSCSKTQDTAPERRIFGDPPTIQTVEQNFFDPAAQVSCDFTDVVLGQVYDQAGCDPSFIALEPQAGPGWLKSTGQPGNNPTTEPGIFIEGTFGEATLKVNVVDPNSTPSQTNILLVSASYREQPPSKIENSLVLFDDGAENQFPFPQKSKGIGERCWMDEERVCPCTSQSYALGSGDASKDDGEFTRRIAFHKKEAEPFLLDCIMRDRRDTLFGVDAGTTIEFKIEAVDRQGNLTTWPAKLQLTTSEDSFSCNGDSCGCCFMQTGGLVDCFGLPGLVEPTYFPGGLCIDFPH